MALLDLTERTRRILAVGIVSGIIAGCAASSSQTVSPDPGGPAIVVVETRVVRVASGLPTVAIHLRARMLIGDQGLATGAGANWSALPGSNAWCDTALEPQPLGPGDPGSVFPVFMPQGESAAAAAVIHDGWLTYQLKAWPGCVATVEFLAGYQHADGAPSVSPEPTPLPALAVVATIQVRGDGTSLDVSARPILTPAPTLPYWAASDGQVIADLDGLIGDWNIAVTPVAAGLTGTNVDVAEWAIRTKSDRADLGHIEDRMGKLLGRIENPDGINAIGDIIINYAAKIQAYDALAAAGLRGDKYGIQEAVGELRIAVGQVPSLMKRFVLAYGQILTPEEQAFFIGLSQ